MQFYPAKDVLNIGWRGTAQNLSLQITDEIGQVVYTQNFSNEISHQSISLKNFANGIYIVRLTGDSVNEMKKITVLK